MQKNILKLVFKMQSKLSCMISLTILCVSLWRIVEVLATQSCLTLCDPMVCSPPSSSVLGILQARVLEREVIPFSRGSS